MRRALIVGIDGYPQAPLSGCVNDARAMAELLRCNDDGSPNFSCRLIDAPPNQITRASLRQAIMRLFEDESDVALLYFSGHGTINNLGGYLVTPDATAYDEGMSMTEILALANQSKVREVVIILDCCHSGALGNPPTVSNDSAVLREGISVLAGSRATQVVVETGGAGLFSSLISAALKGGGADIIGNVTVASMYAYVDQLLGPWEQRPLFKSHVSKLIPLRRCKPKIELSTLRLLPKYFPTPESEFSLDPSYEPDAEPDHPEHEAIFAHLQSYRDARLLVPVGEQHLYYAAMKNKACQLTEQGMFYWRLANGGLL